MSEFALLRAFGLEALAQSNGHAYHLGCFGCGAEVATNRHLPGTRAWCADCKAAGKPAAQRARDLRLRRKA